MARPKNPARVIKWRDAWYLIYTDHLTGKQKRKSCASLRAHSAEQRRELERQYQSTELLDAANVMHMGGRLAYDAQLVTELDGYLADVDRRAEAREANPLSRTGLASSSACRFHATVARFKDWLKGKGKLGIKTSDLEPRMLTSFFDDLAASDGPGRRIRSAAALNHHKQNMRACLGFINGLRPRRFPDFEFLIMGLKRSRGYRSAPVAFTPEVLVRFLLTAIDHDNPRRLLAVERYKGGKVETFEQTISTLPTTPPSRLFALVALTGLRLSEALALRWEHVDLTRGRITVYSHKTGMTRILPLKGAIEGDVAPHFLELLRRWKLEGGSRQYVLPHGDAPTPIFPKAAWQSVLGDAELKNVGPQALRQSFTSYAASVGIPASVAALWQGHSTAVAERFYRAQVLDRNPGNSVEEAMGLADVIKNWTNKFKSAEAPVLTAVGA